jgi:Protein of unknown function (DUF2652)
MKHNKVSSVCFTDGEIINPALILIPDISGFTNFVVGANLEHSQLKIALLLEAILDNNTLGLSVSEIEGDAILFYSFNDTSSFSQVIEQCKLMFRKFHKQLTVFQQNSGCRCEDCKALQQLSLKFVIHYGNLGSVMIKNYCKLFGLDLIVAHRLLKNNIPCDEYILYTDAFENRFGKEMLSSSVDWATSKKECQDYDFGVINFQYMDLSSKRLSQNSIIQNE